MKHLFAIIFVLAIAAAPLFSATNVTVDEAAPEATAETTDDGIDRENAEKPENVVPNTTDVEPSSDGTGVEAGLEADPVPETSRDYYNDDQYDDYDEKRPLYSAFVSDGLLLHAPFSRELDEAGFVLHVAGHILGVRDDLANPTSSGFGGGVFVEGGVNLMLDEYDYIRDDEDYLAMFLLPPLVGGASYAISLVLGGAQEAAIPIGLIAMFNTFPAATIYGMDFGPHTLLYMGSFLAGFGSYFGAAYGSFGSYIFANAAGLASAAATGGSIRYRYKYEDYPNFKGLKQKTAHVLDIDVYDLGTMITFIPVKFGFRHRFTSTPGFILNGTNYSPVDDGRSGFNYYPEAFIKTHIANLVLIQGSIAGYKIYEKEAVPARPAEDFYGWQDLSYSGSVGLTLKRFSLSYAYRYDASTQPAGEYASDVYETDAGYLLNMQHKTESHTVSASVRFSEWLILYGRAAYISADYSFYQVTNNIIGTKVQQITGTGWEADVGLCMEMAY